VKVDLYLNRSELQNVQLKKNQIAVVIDVLRASTTIITALKNGCVEIVPVAKVNEAFKLRNKSISQAILLCGERNEIIVPGFDMSNSPAEYSSDRVKGLKIIFTSTNGAQLFDFSRHADQAVVCGFVNIKNVCSYLTKVKKDIAILCAGKNGQFGLEDAVCGGMLVKELNKRNSFEVNDNAVAAEILYGHFADNILSMLYQSSHGKRLIEIKQEDDLKSCASINSIDVVPIYRDGKIFIRD